MIQIENLSKSYGDHQVLKGINLSFESGMVYGIVGENGAGKTTLFKCISKMEDYSGEIKFNNGLIKDQLGYLLTHPYFLSKITGREYLTLMCNARKIRIENLASKNIFDLPLDKFAGSYSTGMKKKLAISAILLQKNEIFILDEPFNGVDVHSNMLIEEIILKLKERGKMVIISSHIFSTLENTCDYIYLLKDGLIQRKANKGQFTEIEEEMRNVSIGSKLDAFF